MKTEKRIFIDFQIIKKDIPVIGALGFTIYVFLLSRSYDFKHGETCINFIKEGLNIKSCATVRKYLNILSKSQYILGYNNEMSPSASIKYECLRDCSKNFVIVNNKLFLSKINIIGEYGFLLYCIYLKYFNREKGYSYPSYDLIAKLMNVNKQLLTKHVKKLKEEELLKLYEKSITQTQKFIVKEVL